MNICLHWTVLLLNDQIEPSVLMESDLPQVLSSIVYSTGADLGGGGGGGGGGDPPPFLYEE